MVIDVVTTVALTVAFTKRWPTGAMVKSAPWYGLAVTGQIIVSVMIDQFGWFGFEQHSANRPRLAGCALLIAGAAMVAKF